MWEPSDVPRSAARGWALAACLALLCACKPPPTSRYEADEAAARRGLAAMQSAGCGACHQIPGLDWPRGRMGPSLVGFDDIGPIAGRIPNTPANLAAFVRDAPSVAPGSTMPAMPVTASQARDIAAYLHGLDDD